MANLYFEDVEVGDCCMAGPYLVTKSEVVQFAKQYAAITTSKFSCLGHSTKVAPKLALDIGTDRAELDFRIGSSGPDCLEIRLPIFPQQRASGVRAATSEKCPKGDIRKRKAQLRRALPQLNGVPINGDFASRPAYFSSAGAAYCIVIVTPPTAAETSAPTRAPLSCRMTPLAFCNCTPPAPAATAPPAPAVT
jgi:hypothetical protein